MKLTLCYRCRDVASPLLVLCWVVASEGICAVAGGVICFDSVSYEGEECGLEVITPACCQ